MGKVLELFDTIVCFLNGGRQWFSSEWYSELSAQLIRFDFIVFELSFVSNMMYKQ